MEAEQNNTWEHCIIKQGHRKQNEPYKRQRRFFQHQRSEWTAAFLSALNGELKRFRKHKQKPYVRRKCFQILGIPKHNSVVKPLKLRETETAVFNLSFIRFKGIMHEEHLISFCPTHTFCQTIYNLKSPFTEQHCAECMHVGMMPML